MIPAARSIAEIDPRTALSIAGRPYSFMQLWLGPTGGWLIAGRDRDSKSFRLFVVCIGRKKHYSKDGSCAHTRGFIAALRPWYRRRAILRPFGHQESR